MADVIFHGLAINYNFDTEYEDLRIPVPTFYGLAINYNFDTEYEDLRIPVPTFYGINITGYTHPNLTETTAAGPTSKKVYLTNKGNIMINPNDTILIEI